MISKAVIQWAIFRTRSDIRVTPADSRLSPWRLTAVLLLLQIGLSGCALLSSEPGVSRPLSWHALPGWKEDEISQAWEALQLQCKQAPSQPGVEPWCQKAAELPAFPSDARLRAFFENQANPHQLHGAWGRSKGLITGYYEPILNGSLVSNQHYRFPLYTVPEQLLIVDMGELYPELKGKRVRGKLEGNKVVPFYDRASIDSHAQPLSGQELLWVDDPIDAFFLQIQGSGIVRLPDGSQRAIAYAQQNGHPYRAIGKDLVELGEIAIEDVSLFTIRDWLQDNPKRAQALMNRNASYVFFEDAGIVTAAGPKGSLGVSLTTERSVAVDRRVVPLGSPLWLDTTLPDGSSYRRLVFAQDTGGAIKGDVRADVFFGRGARAERLAGTMKQSGRLYLIQLSKHVTSKSRKE